MIKNILYSLFVHFILFSSIYFALIKENIHEIETDQEVLVSISNLENKGVPPINEIINKKTVKPSKIINPEPKKENEQLNSQEQNNKDEKILEPKKEIVKKIEHNENKLVKKTEELKNESEILPKKDSKDLPNDSNNSLLDSFNLVNLKAFKDVSQENVGASLSIRETINIKSQLKLCYKRAIEESGFDSKNNVVIKLQISREGFIENDLDEMIDLEKYNNPEFKDYKIVIDNIKRALDLCSPLRNLPADKYESWKEIILQFDVNETKNN